MTFSRDKARRAACRELLSLSHDELRSVLAPSGRIVLDTPDPGQQALQALLFDCFFSPDREHPFDRSPGRSFTDLLTYFSSVIPCPDRLIIVTNTAARIARYLVPGIRTWTDGSLSHSGVPGLRLQTVGQRSLLLRHLPTGGRLELRDKDPELDLTDLDRLMDDERSAIEQHRSPATRWRPVWREDRFTPGEATAAHHWAPTSNTALHSALMARAYLWWSAEWGHGTRTMSAHRAAARYGICWKLGHSTDAMGRLLTQSPVAIPGAAYTPPPADVWSERGLLSLGRGAVELDGPPAGTG
ncbi:hypothetical protein [Streptomyces silvensis]|nr:hypothetical protein [Streptomyces silvensis]